MAPCLALCPPVAACPGQSTDRQKRAFEHDWPTGHANSPQTIPDALALPGRLTGATALEMPQ